MRSLEPHQTGNFATNTLYPFFSTHLTHLLKKRPQPTAFPPAFFARILTPTHQRKDASPSFFTMDESIVPEHQVNFISFALKERHISTALKLALRLSLSLSSIRYLHMLEAASGPFLLHHGALDTPLALESMH